MSQTQRKKKTLRMHKTIGKPYHQESGLVFKSRDEKVVIGRCEEEEFIELDDETITLADEWKFTLDPDLVDMGSEDDENAYTEPEEVNAEEESTETDRVDAEEESTETDRVNAEEESTEPEEVNAENNIETDVQDDRQPQDNVEVNRECLDSSVDSSRLRDNINNAIMSSLDKVFDELNNKTQELSERDKEMQSLRARLAKLEDDHKKLQNKWTMFKKMLSD